LRGYLAELNAHAAEQRTQDAVKQVQAAAERDRRTSLDDQLKHLLGTIPPEIQDEGLSIISIQVMLRPPGSERSCATAGQLGDALRRLGFVRERRWRDGRSSFRAIWRRVTKDFVFTLHVTECSSATFNRCILPMDGFFQ
jgi:hypothetical protein